MFRIPLLLRRQGRERETTSWAILGVCLVLSSIGALYWLYVAPAEDRHSDDLADSIVIVFSVATLALAFWIAFRKAPFLQRFFPLILQFLILCTILIPSLHGWPNELRLPMMLMLVLSPFGFASAH